MGCYCGTVAFVAGTSPAAKLAPVTAELLAIEPAPFDSGFAFRVDGIFEVAEELAFPPLAK